MMRALFTAASGMEAQQFNMDTISNNLANVNTTGFKGNQARFQDLVYQQIRAAGSPVGASVVPVGQQVGLGVKVSASEKVFTQGNLIQTGDPLNMAIQGDGFFQVTMPDGTTAYTRDGSFTQDANGALVSSDGYFLQPQITIPQNAQSISIGPDGTVTAVVPGSAQPQQLGQIQTCALRQSGRALSVGKQPLHADGRIGYADRLASRAERLGNDSGRLSGEFKRAGRARNRQHDRCAARIRSKLQSD